MELCEVQDDSDDESQTNKHRYATFLSKFLFHYLTTGTDQSSPSLASIRRANMFSSGLPLVKSWCSTHEQKRCVSLSFEKTSCLTVTKMIARHKIAGAGSLKGLEFAKNGRCVPPLPSLTTLPTHPHPPPSRLVTNSSDRTLRQFNLPLYAPPSADGAYIEQDLEPMYRFSDPINKVAWHGMSYSPDGEWLAGGAADNATHKIYIWDISNDGQFATALDGGREPLVHLHVCGR